MSMALINRPETIKSLFPDDAFGRLVKAIYAAVERSFRIGDGQMKMDIKRSEVRSRIAACINWAKILRGDHKWGLERICGQFDDILRCHLAKCEYKIPTRKLWMPEDGE